MLKLNLTHGYFSTVACRYLALLTKPGRTSSNLGFRCALSRWFDLSIWNWSVTIISAAKIHIKLWPIIIRAHGQVTTGVCRITFYHSFQVPVYVVWVVFVVLGFFVFLKFVLWGVFVCAFCIVLFCFKGDRKYLFPKARVNICLLAALVQHGIETPSDCC